MSDVCTIAAISLDSGISKEVLRKWEERYGFPIPDRQETGMRLYRLEHIRRLKLIKRLLDDGMRPGKVVLLDETQLQVLIREKKSAFFQRSKAVGMDSVVQWLQANDPSLLSDQLHRELIGRGFRDFILNGMPAMNESVGNANASGDLSINAVYLYAQTIHSLIRHDIANCGNAPGAPRILLTTPPGEQHVGDFDG